jgi:hypothetical protein
LGTRFEIETIIRGNTDEVCRFYPLGNEGVYVKNTGYFGNLNRNGYAKKEVYSLYEGLLFDIDSEGYIQAFPSGKRFMVIRRGRHWGHGGDFDIYSVKGKALFKSIKFDEYAYGPFDKKRDWRFFSNMRERDWLEGLEKSRGTQIIDEKGNLRFRLNADSYCQKNYPTGRSKATYGSDNYICQIANLPENTMVDEKGRTTVSYDTFLEVYDGNGNLLWDFKSPSRDNNARLFVSDNEEFLCLLLGRNEKLVVFETAFGEKVYELTNLFPGQLMEGGMISDDGNVLMVSSRYVYRPEDDSDDPEDTRREFEFMVEALKKPYNISIIKNGNVTGSVSAIPEKGLINGFITPNGEYLIAGVPSTVCVYKIK